ncbi:VanZ family protein [Cohnella lubricantis]|uniref:VanZ family protein n=1 Tax=Cohnella lubricantis TaxID=2163172 RepID=A0A841TCY9_9BACL|nr:VanZ family protein [Cohnella lubricantis]MBB6676321.1 VanZ family protein [Cohnella lubricantis]MBP2120310.1 glycopeptide antibiotics resistance protein/uncharacterized RDD family membrane protein YckC [Cohnella lubricantis]
MLQFYLYPISYAFLSFPLIAALFTVPFLIVQYRRHGYLHKYRALVLYLLLLYLMNAYCLIILPMPPSVHNSPPKADAIFQWVPLRFIADILGETGASVDQPLTYWRVLTERALWQELFNVLLFVPFGLFLRHYFRTDWRKCLYGSLGLSLFFELTQVSGLYGIFDYPYRQFDVDDLLSNTAGGLLGYLVAEWFSAHLPRIDRLDAFVDLSKHRVSYTRRGVAFLIDWWILAPVGIALKMLGFPFPYAAEIFLYFMVIPWLMNGQTFGKWVVRIRLQGESGRVRLPELFVRYGLLYWLLGGLNMLYLRIGAIRESAILFILCSLVLFLVNAAFALHAIRCFIDRRRKLFYESVSGTGHSIT